MNPLDAFYHTVYNYPGSCEALAPRLGISAQVLRNKANPNSVTNKPMLDDADRLMTITNDYQILHALAEKHGFLCIQKPECDTSYSDLAVLEIIAEVWGANGEVGQSVHAGLSDGRLTHKEIHEVRQAIYRAQTSLTGLLMRLESIAEK